ncbi:hypothetical protein CBL_21043, partial [Carabus blaptoides fortunei]
PTLDDDGGGVINDTILFCALRFRFSPASATRRWSDSLTGRLAPTSPRMSITGIDILGDVGANRPVRESFQRRVAEAGENLKRKAQNKIVSLITPPSSSSSVGAGYKRRRTGKK